MLWLIWIWLACAKGDPCDLALQRQEAAVRACGGTLNREPWHGQVCSTSEAALLSCEADCMEETDCRAFVDAPREYADTYGRARDYDSCIMECPTPW